MILSLENLFIGLIFLNSVDVVHESIFHGTHGTILKTKFYGYLDGLFLRHFEYSKYLKYILKLFFKVLYIAVWNRSYWSKDRMSTEKEPLWAEPVGENVKIADRWYNDEDELQCIRCGSFFVYRIIER